MSENYVTKDLFEETIRRIETSNEAFKAEIKAQNAEFRENVSLMLMGIDKRVSNLENKFDSLENRFDTMIHTLTIFGTLFTITGAIVAIIALFK